jgi:hypothetical protein
VAPFAWWLTRGRIEIDLEADSYRFGRRNGRAREIRVIWLDHRFGWKFRELLSLTAGLADGSEICIIGGRQRGLGMLGVGSKELELEHLGHVIARRLEVPLQRRTSEL